MKRIICIFRGHRFTKSLAKSNNLEVKECERCKTHLNIHHRLGQCFISKSHSLYPEVVEMQKLFERLDKRDGVNL
jgi:hypothetical protein